MKNSIEVYWGEYDEGKNKELLSFPPSPLLKELTTYPLPENFEEYFRCPASQDELKNTFVIKSSSDLEIQINNQEIKGYGFETNPLYTRSVKNRWVDLNLENLFFSSDSVKISIYPAYLSDNDITRSSRFLPGTFNISKWIRPINPSYILHSNNIKIKRGDALYYIKFHTDKTIKFKNFKPTIELQTLIQRCLTIKFYYKKLKLKFLYDLFLEKNYNKRVLKEIKSNLTGY